LGPVSRLFQTFRVPAIAFDFLAQGLVARSRTMVALFTGALTLGAALLGLGLAYTDQMPGVLRTAGSVLLVATMGVAFVRRHALAAIAALVGGILMIVATGPGWLSSTGLASDDLAWVRVTAVLLFLALNCTLAYIVGQGPRERFLPRQRQGRQ
jgi:hypothetical protein